MSELDPQVVYQIGSQILGAHLGSMENPTATSDGHLDRLAELGVRAAIAMVAAVPRVQARMKAEAEAVEAAVRAAEAAEAAAEAERVRQAEEATTAMAEANRVQAEVDAAAKQAELEAAVAREQAGMTPPGSPSQEAPHAASEGVNSAGGMLVGGRSKK